MENFYTYIYLDPRKQGNYSYNGDRDTFDYEPIYIGKGCRKRLDEHWDTIEKNKSRKYSPFLNKLKSLHNKGLKPIFYKILENVSEQEALDEEIRLIWVIGRKDLFMGSLLNRTWGGEGVSGFVHSEESRRKNSERNKGKKLSEETKRKMSEAFKGRKFTEEWRKKLSENNAMKKPENKKKISELRTGMKFSEEHKSRISKSKKGSIPWNKGKTGIYSDETRKKMSETHKGKKMPPRSPEHRKKISEMRKGRKHSKETKRKISETKKGQKYKTIQGEHIK